MESEFWIIPLSIGGFVLLWSLIIWLTSRLAGWWQLAQHYRDFDSYYGRKLRGKSGNFGAASYGGILTFGANYQGCIWRSTFCFRSGIRHSLSRGMIFKSKNAKDSLEVKRHSLSRKRPK